MALGTEVITSTVEGRERYGVAIRYPRALRSDPQAIAREVQVALPGGGTVPLGEVAKVELTHGVVATGPITSPKRASARSRQVVNEERFIDPRSLLLTNISI